MAESSKSRLSSIVGAGAPLDSQNWPRHLRAQAIASTQARIEAQRAVVQRMQPHSEAHKTAVEVLLLLEDSLHELHEARELLDRLDQAEQPKK